MDEYIKAMVERFLSWKLPEDFYPDCGIEFKPFHPNGYTRYQPVGTNLFTAAQATDMFARCAESLIEDLARKDADCHANGRRATELEAELARLREELAKAKAEWMPLHDTGLAVPMELLNEAQGRKNHGQSLAMLKSRGGLSPCEALAIAEKRDWRKVRESLAELAKLASTKNVERVARRAVEYYRDDDLDLSVEGAVAQAMREAD